MTSIVKSLHWFDPFARFTIARIQARVEQAADDIALRDATPGQAIAYGRMLLRFAEQRTNSKSSPVLGLIQFANARGLRARIQRLSGKRTSSSVVLRSLFAMSVIGLAIAGLTDAASEVSKKTEPVDSSLLESIAQPFNVRDDEQGEQVTESYDVGAIAGQAPNDRTW